MKKEDASKKDERTMYIVLAIILMIAIGIIVTWYFTKDRYEDKDYEKTPKVTTKEKEKKEETKTTTETNVSKYVATTTNCTPEENNIEVKPVVVETTVADETEPQVVKPEIILPEEYTYDTNWVIMHSNEIDFNSDIFLASAKDINGNVLPVEMKVKLIKESDGVVTEEKELEKNEEGKYDLITLDNTYTHVLLIYSVVNNISGETNTKEIKLKIIPSQETEFTLYNLEEKSREIKDVNVIEVTAKLSEGSNFENITKENINEYITAKSYGAKIDYESVDINKENRTITFTISPEADVTPDTVTIKVLDNDSTLKQLTIEGIAAEKITYEEANHTYTVTVSKYLDKLEITGETSSNKATIGTKELILNPEEDEEKFTIIVTAEDSTSTEYSIIVKKEAE